MSDLKFWIFSFIFFNLFTAMIFFVVFGQVTVRKLRKNPNVKDLLGVEFASGWDILNVAYTLSMPRRWARKLSIVNSAYFPHSDAIYKNTNKLDRILGRVFSYSQIIFFITIITTMTLEKMGVVQ